MSIATEAAAKRACARANWQLTNLQLQKILYVAHMVTLGKLGKPLLREQFEAWDYGPVLPTLYNRAKMFGRNAVQDIFLIDVDGHPEAVGILDSVVDRLKSWSPGQLVAYTHEPVGAWAKHYSVGKRGVIIPNEDISDEFRRRAGR